MSLNARRPSRLLPTLLAFATACGNPVDPNYEGEPLVTLEGQMSLSQDATVDGPVRMALGWYPGMFADDSAAPLSQPRSIVTEDVVYESSFPVNYRFHLYRPPPTDALVALGNGYQGKGAVGVLMAYRDGNDNAKLDTIPATGSPVDRVVGSSLVWTASPAFFVVYLDSEQPGATGLKKGFNLVKVVNAETSVPVPLNTRVPLALSGGPLFDALVCEAGFGGGTTVERPCGIDFDGEQAEQNALRIEGSVTVSEGDVSVDLTVTHEEAFVQDAQVTLGGQPLAYAQERGSYGLTVYDGTVFAPGRTLELRVVSQGKELRRTLTIPGGFDITAPAPGGTLKFGAALPVEWTRAAGAVAYEVSLLQGPDMTLEHVFTTEVGHTFPAVEHHGAADLVVRAVSQPQDNDTLGWVEVKVARSVPVYFEP